MAFTVKLANYCIELDSENPYLKDFFYKFYLFVISFNGQTGKRSI